MRRFAVERRGAGVTGLAEHRERPDRPRRQPLRRVAAAAVLIVVPVASFAARAAHPETYPRVPLGELVCGDRPLTLHLIDDRSGSTWVTDPMRRRERELAQLAGWDTDPECELEVSAASFDNVTAPLAPTAVTDVAEEQVAAALPVDGPESSSTMAPVLAQAARWAGGRPDAHHVAVIATDGMVDLDDTFDEIRAFPGDVIIVALGGPLPAEWTRVRGSVARIVVLDGQVGLGDVARSVADAVRPLGMDNDNKGPES